MDWAVSCLVLFCISVTGMHVSKYFAAFVDWWWQLCCSNLLPCASYQRLKTSLEWMRIVLDALVHRPNTTQRKGRCPGQAPYFPAFLNHVEKFCTSVFIAEFAVEVLEHARSLGLWDFFNESTCNALLCCILDGTNEVSCIYSTHIPVMSFMFSSSGPRDELRSFGRVLFSGGTRCPCKS